jgi:calcineurin-like phosphoesterase family protein
MFKTIFSEARRSKKVPVHLEYRRMFIPGNRDDLDFRMDQLFGDMQAFSKAMVDGNIDLLRVPEDAVIRTVRPALSI